MIRKLNTINILSLMILALLALGCTDLEPSITDSVVIETGDGGFQGDPEELLNSVYRGLEDFTAQNNIYSLTEHTTDELIGPTRGTDWGDNGVWRQLHNHQWSPDHQFMLDAWNALHSNVFLANQALASNPDAAQAAQARFLRAFNMFYLVDFFGQVPFREVNEGSEIDPRVLTRVEALNFVITDLEAAIPGLADGGPGTDAGIANKAAAQALLAKVYLNRAVYSVEVTAEGPGAFSFNTQDMDQVIGLVDEITAAGYALEPEYFGNFDSNGSNEIIFATQTDVGSSETRWRMTIHYNQFNPEVEGGGWNGFATLADFYGLFEEDDIRRGGTAENGIGFGFLEGQQFGVDGEVLQDRGGNPLVFTPEVGLAGNNERAGIRVLKYHPSDFLNLVLLRYADAYLMKIEAILRGGAPTGGETAQSMLDNLRNVRGVESIPATLDEILNERGRELYWEGWRRNDQVRFGTFDDPWEGKTNSDAFRLLYPIPQIALDSNPNLEQNPGY